MSDTHSGNIQFPYIGQYLPVTNWAKFFNFNPTFDIDLFAENEGDRELEQRVLNEVGSYGKQLGRVMKVLRILLEECEARGDPVPLAGPGGGRQVQTNGGRP